MIKILLLSKNISTFDLSCDTNQLLSSKYQSDKIIASLAAATNLDIDQLTETP